MLITATTDVLVIGAGLSGLQAALDVQKAGLSCLILEATHRIGGKVRTLPSVSVNTNTARDHAGTADKVVDLGPAWINDTSQSKMWALGKRYGIQFQQQIQGDQVLELNCGKVVRFARGELPIPIEHQWTIFPLIIQIDNLGKQIRTENFQGPISKRLDQVTFQQWIKDQITAIVVTSTPASKADSSDTAEKIAFAVDVFDTLCACIIGADTNEFSALFMIRDIENATGFSNISGSEKDGGQYLRPYGGSISYVNGIASELKPNTVILSQPVTRITQHDHHVVVTTTPTTPSTSTRQSRTESKVNHYRARKVIVSVPTALYRHITFNPPLPQKKHRIATSAKMGYYTKLIYVYATPWWRRSFTILSKSQSSSQSQSQSSPAEASITTTDHVQLIGQASSLVGPVLTTLDTSIDERGQYSITAFICGEKGRVWSRTPGGWPARKATATKHLLKLLTSTGISDNDGLELASVPEPLAVHELQWSEERWFEGAPSAIYSVGSMTVDGGDGDDSSTVGREHKDVVCEPFRHVHFVGTETSDVWEGYMEGAVRSGERGAEEVVELLK